MKAVTLAGLISLAAMPVLAQTPAAPTSVPLGQIVELPDVQGATADPTCGGRAAMARIAFCTASTQAGMQAVADTYTADFARQGWLVGTGNANLIVYVRRKEAGGCEAFQMQAFSDGSRASGPDAPAYLAFAAIPGDVCVDEPAETGVAPQ